MGSTLQKAPRQQGLRPRRPLAVASTGDHCPVSGTWVAEGEEMRPQRFFEGNIMPPVQGASVVSRLAEAASPWHVLL